MCWKIMLEVWSATEVRKEYRRELLAYPPTQFTISQTKGIVRDI